MNENLASWARVVCFSFTGFVFMTTEITPMAILPEIAAGLGRSASEAGLLVTGYAWVVTIMSLPLTILTARQNRRMLILVIMAMFGASHVYAGLAPNFASLMAARVLVALTHALFWSIAPAMAIRLAPEGERPKALALMSSGSLLGTALGIPVATMLGHVLGWRSVFLVIAAVSILVLLVIMFSVPSMPNLNSGSLDSLPFLMRRGRLLFTYALAVFAVTGHYAAMTYFSTFLGGVWKFGDRLVEVSLVVLGLSSIAGNFIGSALARRAPGAAVIAPMLVLLLTLCAMKFLSGGLAGALLLCMVWGASFTAATLVFQMRVLTIASDATDVAQAIYSGLFNIGIGGGAMIGGRVLEHWGLPLIGPAGALFVAVSALICAAGLWHYRAESLPGI
ncbi:MAG: MFS transporter [Synergistaceae bacterium]|jgi:DHA1 family L-arabinose/isopropyl-beta-D-thiogalactopyranoside export protein-like MFS transporter|nr:MFS transporter [Synergistaceae bacterium]